MASGDVVYQYPSGQVRTVSSELASAYDFADHQEIVTLSSGVPLPHGYGTSYPDANSLVGHQLDTSKLYVVKVVEA